MGALKCTMWALPRGAEAVPLPHLHEWKVSPTDGDAGLVEFSYPETGYYWSTLAKTVNDDVDLSVDVTLTAYDGRTWSDVAIIDSADLDDVAETGMGAFSGLLQSRILDEVVIPYASTGDQGETTVSGTAGQIVRQLVQAAQARGALAGVTLDFTDDKDSAGQPWSRSAVLRFAAHTTYRAMLGTVRGYQLGEWTLTKGRVLRIFNVDGGLGVDRTTGANPLTLEHGRDLGDAPRKWRVRDAVTALFGAGKDGLYASATDATAQARRGRRIEGTYSFGNTADQGTLDALTQRRLSTQTAGRTEVSHEIPLAEGSPTPLIDFGPSDYVFSATRQGVTRRRVRQITVAGTAEQAGSAAVTMGVLIDEAAVRQQDELDRLSSGESIAGTSQPPPEVDDGSTPVAPKDLVATSLWFSNNEGAGEASVTAGWTGVPDSRVDGYVVEWRYTNNALGAGWRRMPLTTALTLSWSAVAPGQGVAVHVAAQNKWGRLSPWSTEYQFSTETDGTAPPTSSTPAPYSSLGFLVVPWDGKGSVGEPMPGDFLRAEVHFSTTSGFAPHRPLLAGTKILDEKSSTTYAGEMRGAMDGVTIDIPASSYAVPANPDVPGSGTPGTTYFVRLVLVDRTGNASAPSAQGSVEAQAVADNEIGSMSVSRLRAGVINALVGIGKRLYAGDPAGAGWEGDAAGFRFYSMIDGARTAILEFTAATAQLVSTGTFQTGKIGRRAVLSGISNTLRFYPSADETRWAEAGGFIPPNYPDSVAVRLSSSRANNADNIADVFAMPGQGGISTCRPDDNSAVFAMLQVFRDTIKMGMYDSTTAYRIRGGSLTLSRFGFGETSFYHYTDAGVTLGNLRFGNTFTQLSFDVNNRLYMAADGVQLISNGAVKSFVVDHPTDPDRWLVHGCTESPTAGVEYTGVATITDHTATVTLPGWFESLVEQNGRTVQATVELPAREPDPTPPGPPVDAPGPAREGEPWPPPAGMLARSEWSLLPRAAASAPRDGRFRIACDGPDGTRVAWHVRGTRKGAGFEVEPLRSQYDAHGDGPYRYLTRKTPLIPREGRAA